MLLITLTLSKKCNQNTQPVYKKEPRVKCDSWFYSSSAILLAHIFSFFSKNKNAYQTDKTCDIIGTALTIRLGKGGITDARTSQNSTSRSHREYHLMAGDSLVRRSLRQVTFMVSAI